jgi:molybdenum-dependent DNA-binding transcriptional regulator ModE
MVEDVVKLSTLIRHKGNIKAAAKALHINWNRFTA